MRRTIALAALIAASLCTVAALAQQPYRQTQTAPAQRQVFTPSNTRPAWAAPQQCFTDDGYGRFTPCEGGGKGY